MACVMLSVLLILAGLVGCMQMKMQDLDYYPQLPGFLPLKNLLTRNEQV